MLEYVSPMQFEQRWLADQEKRAAWRTRLWDAENRCEVKTNLASTKSGGRSATMNLDNF